MLPSSSWMMAMVRMFWVPVVCWVQPMAYMMVPAMPRLSGGAVCIVDPLQVGLGVPVIVDTVLRSYRLKCFFNS
jgi:hypothetical protein